MALLSIDAEALKDFRINDAKQILISTFFYPEIKLRQYVKACKNVKPINITIDDETGHLTVWHQSGYAVFMPQTEIIKPTKKQ
jgi:hypothetical protein